MSAVTSPPDDLFYFLTTKNACALLAAYSVVGPVDTFLARVRSWHKCIRAAETHEDACLKVSEDVGLKAGFFKLAETEGLPDSLAKVARQKLEDTVLAALVSADGGSRKGNFAHDVGGIIGRTPQATKWGAGVYITFLYRVRLNT